MAIGSVLIITREINNMNAKNLINNNQMKKTVITLIITFLSFIGYSQKHTQYDTIAVIMLVCDTTTHGKLLPYEIPNVFWIRGFKIIEEVQMKQFISAEYPIFKQTIGYLDKNKKPVNLVVWDNRTI